MPLSYRYLSPTEPCTAVETLMPSTPDPHRDLDPDAVEVLADQLHALRCLI